MNLIWKYNVSASEDEMQSHVAKYFTENGFIHQSGYDIETINCKVYREVRIPIIFIGQIIHISVYMQKHTFQTEISN